MKQMKQMKQQSGFTLVELVTTMVIVGTLAAVAVPKFADAAKDARITKLESLRNSVITASGSVHNTVLSKGKIDIIVCPGETFNNTTKADNSQNASGTVCTEVGVANLVNGYPAAGTVGTSEITGTGIINVAGLTGKFRPDSAELNKAGFGASVADTVDTNDGTTKIVTFSVLGGSGTNTTSGAQENPTCKFTYTETTKPGVPPVVSELTAATTTGC